jgi:hypothetical protein
VAAVHRRGVLRGMVAASMLSLLAERAGAGTAAATLAGAPPPEPFPEAVSILVAGPPDGRMDHWGSLIGRALGRALPQGTTVDRTTAGGADGVTAANQFATRVAPDGGTALLMPGDTPLAWLTGDPRARFDAASWLPVIAGLTPGVLVSRLPLAAVTRGKRLRVATSAPAGPELPALLALDLMGIEPVSVGGLHHAESARQAVWSNAADAMFVTGPDAMRRVAAATAAGAAPLFTLGVPGESGLARDPLLPTVPTASELVATLRGTPPPGPLQAAWRATVAASAIEFALVLPRLTPASLVSVWRRAGAEAAADLQDQSQGVRLVTAPEANAATSVACDMAALLELRRWLATRFGWQPS